MESQHTPGPWKVTEFKAADGTPCVGVAAVNQADGGAICWPTGASDAQTTANAKLIAAAPAMKEFCEFIKDHAFESGWPGDGRAYVMLNSIFKSI